MENKQNKPMSIKEQLMRISAFIKDAQRCTCDSCDGLTYDFYYELNFDAETKRFKLEFEVDWNAEADWGYYHSPRYQKYKEERKFVAKYWNEDFREMLNSMYLIDEAGYIHTIIPLEEGVFDPSERIEVDDGVYSTDYQYFQDRGWEDCKPEDLTVDVICSTEVHNLAEEALKKSPETQALIKSLEEDLKNVKVESVKNSIKCQINNIEAEFKDKFGKHYAAELLNIK